MQNINYPIEVGDTWAYFDEDREKGWVEWVIESIQEDDGTLTMVKGNGENVGYRARQYPLTAVRVPKWKWVRGTAEPTVTFNCPRCSEWKALLQGDYVCADCRAILDADDG